MASYLNTQTTTWEDLGAALELASLATGDAFVILERSDQEYMQCLCEAAGWVLEKREGGDDRHYRAGVELMATISPDAPTRDPILARKFAGSGGGMRLYLTFEEVGDAMIAYLRGAPEPEWLRWELIEV
ncbi:hypothetical protein EH30_13680 [Erythrobacter sp. JL475]|nr:hypothetical protein EH30_13680 [Erythrobacter sp. JL475]